MYYIFIACIIKYLVVYLFIVVYLTGNMKLNIRCAAVGFGGERCIITYLVVYSFNVVYLTCNINIRCAAVGFEGERVETARTRRHSETATGGKSGLFITQQSSEFE